MKIDEIKKALIGKRLVVRHNPREGSRWQDVGVIIDIKAGKPAAILTNRPYCIFNPWKETFENRQDIIWLAALGSTVKTTINSITHFVDAVEYKIKKNKQ